MENLTEEIHTQRVEGNEPESQDNISMCWMKSLSGDTSNYQPAQQNCEDSVARFKWRDTNCCCCNREKESKAGCDLFWVRILSVQMSLWKHVIIVQTCTWVLSPSWEQSSLKWLPKPGVWSKKSWLISWETIWLLDLVCKPALFVCFWI